MNSAKAESTALKILEAALELFREQGFDGTTMRAIAERAGVATGAAYYYYPSKDAIVLDFYERSRAEMEEKLRLKLDDRQSLEDALVGIVGVKFAQFGPNREVMRALLRNGADPGCALSPFSAETKYIRDLDMAWFQLALKQSGIRVPRDLAPTLPQVLWFFQMGLILFWVTDNSPAQNRTKRLLPLACKIVASLVRLSSLPLMRPLRKPVLQVIEIVLED